MIDLIALHINEGLHERVKDDPEAWAALPFVGEMCGLELRNCTCQSTLARVIQVAK